ncbi:MAG: 3-dehydroquinate synthase II [Promethearchaeota archaeon]
MKKIILKYDSEIPQESFNELFQAALNYGIFDIYTDAKYADKIIKLERIHVYSEDRELNPEFLILNEPDTETLQTTIKETNKSNILLGAKFSVANKEDEQKIIKVAKEFSDLAFIIVKATDWKVIPFENLIAALSDADILLFADVDSVEEARTMLKTLEKGADGILFRPGNANDIIELKKLTGTNMKLDLTTAEIIDIKDIPKADRVCVDTTSILRAGEGMLVGSTAKGFVFVHAEVFESEFVNSRPFRVNAGDVSAYVLVPSFNEKGELITKTNYLSELKAGDDVIVVDVNGNVRIVSVGRVKIETRPMLLFKLMAKVPNKNKDKGSDKTIDVPINIILQNAETIRVVKEDLKVESVVNLKRGDKIIVYLGPGATHFGTTIKETIIEK